MTHYYRSGGVMSWNYRIIRSKLDGADYFALHEVFYDEDGNPTSRTDAPVDFGGDSPEEVIEGLRMALSDAQKHPVMNDPWPHEVGDETNAGG
jgi:hypothetical protein